MKPPKAPAFQFYASDWFQSVSSLTLEERGAHITLLAYAWEHRYVPNEMHRIATILGTHLGAARRIFTEVSKRWRIDAETGQWVNERLEKERVKQAEFRRLQSDKGKASATARATKQSTGRQPRLQPIRQPEHQPEVNSSSSSSEHPQSKEHSSGVAPVVPFEAFWRLYPRKTGKQAAVRAWNALKPTEATLSAMRDALSWQVNQPQWTKNGGEFIPHGSSWLNGRRWEDEPFHPLIRQDETDRAWDEIEAKVGQS